MTTDKVPVRCRGCGKVFNTGVRRRGAPCPGCRTVTYIPKEPKLHPVTGHLIQHPAYPKDWTP